MEFAYGDHVSACVSLSGGLGHKEEPARSTLSLTCEASLVDRAGRLCLWLPSPGIERQCNHLALKISLYLLSWIGAFCQVLGKMTNL